MLSKLLLAMLLFTLFSFTAQADPAAASGDLDAVISDSAISDAYHNRDFTVVYYQYAYNKSGTVNLYKYGDDIVVATVESGSRVAITDMQERGRTYVMYGGKSGWAKNSDLVSKLPEETAEKQDQVSYRYLITGDGINTQMVELYMEATGSATSGALPPGTLVALHEWSNGRAHITFGSWDAWVPAANLSSRKGSAPEQPETTTAPSSGNEKTRIPAATATPSPKSARTVKKKSSPAVSLVPSEDLPQDKALAYLFVPNTGKCSLRTKASEKADILLQCKGGTVVQVLDYGRKFCRINYKGRAGFVLTRCLRFISDQEPLGTGVLTYNGKATGRTTINIRSSSNKKSHKIGAWRTGTKVDVFSLNDGWYEVEYNGVHGYVMEKFLTMNEEARGA